MGKRKAQILKQDNYYYKGFRNITIKNYFGMTKEWSNSNVPKGKKHTLHLAIAINICKILSGYDGHESTDTLMDSSVKLFVHFVDQNKM